jgi:hypothetical protein
VCELDGRIERTHAHLDETIAITGDHLEACAPRLHVSRREVIG